MCERRIEDNVPEDEHVLLLEGLDNAFIGFSQRCGEPIVAVYSRQKIAGILMSRDGMTEDDAHEFIDFNITGAWVGPKTPVIMFQCEVEFAHAMIDPETNLELDPNRN